MLSCNENRHRRHQLANLPVWRGFWGHPESLGSSGKFGSGMRWYVKGSQKYDNQSASVLSCGWQPLQLAPTRLQTSHQSPIHPAHGLRHPGVIALEVNVGADQALITYGIWTPQ